MGRVECSPAPVQWVGEALLLRLAADGFHVVTLDRARSSAPLRVNLTLKTFFVDELPDAPVPGVVADMEVHLAVTTASGLSAERNFFVRRRQATRERGVRLKAMRAAGHELTARVSDALVQLAQQFPEVGVDARKAPSARGALP
jgi:nucleoside-diphosphate-sugar epimerase